MLQMGRCSSLFLLLLLGVPLLESRGLAHTTQDPILAYLQTTRLDLEAQVKEDRKRLRQVQQHLERAITMSRRAALATDSDAVALAKRREEQASTNVQRALDVLHHHEHAARQLVLALERYEHCLVLRRTLQESRAQDEEQTPGRSEPGLSSESHEELPEMSWSLGLALTVATEEWSQYGEALEALHRHYEMLKHPLGLEFSEADLVDLQARWRSLGAVERLARCQAHFFTWPASGGAGFPLVRTCQQVMVDAAEILGPYVPVLREASTRLGLPTPPVPAATRDRWLGQALAQFEMTLQATTAAPGGGGDAGPSVAKLSECYQDVQQTVSQ